MSERSASRSDTVAVPRDLLLRLRNLARYSLDVPSEEQNCRQVEEEVLAIFEQPAAIVSEQLALLNKARTLIEDRRARVSFGNSEFADGLTEALDIIDGVRSERSER